MFKEPTTLISDYTAVPSRLFARGYGNLEKRETRRDETRWDGMGWDGMRWDETRRDATRDMSTATVIFHSRLIIRICRLSTDYMEGGAIAFGWQSKVGWAEKGRDGDYCTVYLYRWWWWWEYSNGVQDSTGILVWDTEILDCTSTSGGALFIPVDS